MDLTTTEIVRGLQSVTEEDLERWADIGRCEVYDGGEDCSCEEEGRRGLIASSVPAAVKRLNQLESDLQAARLTIATIERETLDRAAKHLEADVSGDYFRGDCDQHAELKVRRLARELRSLLPANAEDWTGRPLGSLDRDVTRP